MDRASQLLNGYYIAFFILVGVLIANIPVVTYAADNQPLHTSVLLSCMEDAACKQRVDQACTNASEKTALGAACRTIAACGENQECRASWVATVNREIVNKCEREPNQDAKIKCLIHGTSSLNGKITTVKDAPMNIKDIASTNTWHSVNGMAFDVSIGGDGSIWHVGGNGSLYRKMPKDTHWTAIHKGSRAPNRHVVQVEAQNKDRAFILTKDNNMWIVDKGKPWENVAGAASYIASNAKNELYHLGMDGKTAYRYEYNPKYKKFWHKFNGVIAQISVDPNGNLWGVGTNKGIYQRKSKQINDVWHPYPGATSQVSVSSTGNVWHIGGDLRTAYHLQANSKNWQEISPAPEKLIDIAAGPHGELWGVGESKKMYVVRTKKLPSMHVN